MSKPLSGKARIAKRYKKRTFKKFEDPYGIFKDSKVSDKEIDQIISSWDKTVDELVKSLK